MYKPMQVMATFGSDINSTACANMPYADITIKEVLRYQAIIGEVYRRALKTFGCGGYTIPKVCQLRLPIQASWVCIAMLPPY